MCLLLIINEKEMGMDTSQSKTHIFYSPNKVLFGIDAVKDVAAVVKQLGGREVLIVTDPGVVEAGLVEPVKAPLDSDRVPFFTRPICIFIVCLIVFPILSGMQ